MTAKEIIKVLLASVSCLSLSGISLAQVNPSQTIQPNIGNHVAQNTVIKNDFYRFTPKPTSTSKKLDYSILDQALADVVVDLGPSTRIWQRKPDPETGSRIVTGHKSAFRLEGKRLTFSYLNDEYRASLTEYRKDLEQIATDYDIASFPKKEQLAFWFNLHNIAMIEQIAIDYPTKRPRNIRIKIDGRLENIHDAKFLNVKGMPLSLRDIREKIVYANWNDPDVIYGFFHGDIGGPSVQEYAYTADRLDYMLESNAHEFINSLRGVRRASSKNKVSKMYKTEGSFFFADWENELKAHLLSHANEKVKKEILSSDEIEIAFYDDIVADLAGGGTTRVKNLALSNGETGNTPAHIARLLRETEDKYEILRDRGVVGSIRNGRVIIEDIETVDEPFDENEEGSLISP